MPRRTNSRKSRGQYFTRGNWWMGISLYVVNGQNDIAVARKLRRGRGTVILYAPLPGAYRIMEIAARNQPGVDGSRLSNRAAAWIRQ